jgi:hypothetical protein
MRQVPENFYTEVTQHPTLSGRELFKNQFAPSDRTARRWKNWVLNGQAVPANNFYDVPPKIDSQQLEDVEGEDEFDVHRFLEIAPKLVANAQAHDPVITHDTFTFEGDHPIAVIFPSCAHLGGRYTAYEDFRKIFYRVLNTPHIYWASLGDDVEGFLPQFPDTDAVLSQIADVRRQEQILCSVLEELACRNKLLFGMASQHGGSWPQKRHGINPIKQLYRNCGVPFYDGKVYLKFVVGNQTYQIAAAHEFPGSSQFNPLHAQVRARLFDFPEADLVVMGDKHKAALMELPASQWELGAGNRKSDTVLLLQAGTAKTGPDKFAIHGWSVGQLGWPIVVFYPREHRLKASKDFDDIEYWLGLKAAV